MQRPKGTYDVYGIEGKKILYIEKIIKKLMSNYNYEYFRIPTFEYSEVFHRGVGETTDIVNKETYTFEDRGGRLLTLRPEGTAGVVRSFIENKLTNTTNTPYKVWYYGQMFRYERPQKGRYREFYQFGIEVLKSNNPLLDAEVISIAVNFFKQLGLEKILVNINTIGDIESRKSYNEALLKYLKKHYNKLSNDSKKRYQINPLRILDSKDKTDQLIIENAPIIKDYLNETSINHYEKVKKYLNLLNIEYVEKENLVRGLDYYTHTVFEVEASIKGFGSHNVLCGGGRYDLLVETLGGPKTAGVGFAMGLERIISALEQLEINLIEDEIDVYVVPLTEEEVEYSYKLTEELRLLNYKTEFDYLNKNLKNNFKSANKLNTKFIVIIGEDELKNNYLTIQNNKTKSSVQLTKDEFFEFLSKQIGDLNEKNK